MDFLGSMKVAILEHDPSDPVPKMQDQTGCVLNGNALVGFVLYYYENRSIWLNS